MPKNNEYNTTTIRRLRFRLRLTAFALVFALGALSVALVRLQREKNALSTCDKVANKLFSQHNTNIWSE